LKFRLYDCRHTFATRVLENGIDLLTLASMLGHSNLSEVVRYAHPSETRKNDAIKLMQGKTAKAV
jgi:site-specific recombinase XerD